METSRQIHGTVFDGFEEFSHIAQSDVAHSLEEMLMEELDLRSLDTIGTTLMMKYVEQLDVSKKMNKDMNFE